MKRRSQLCSNCRYFCQDVDSENRLYFDDKSGECRRHPPRDNFSWLRTRSYHWCGDWEGDAKISSGWQKLSTHPRNDGAVLLYKKDSLCRQSGMIVAYWNSAFSKWHDDGDRLFEHNEFSAWMDLPEKPDGQ